MTNKASEPLRTPRPIRSQKWSADIEPHLSILCVTYNHYNFIRDAIDGFLMQETTFPVEILIHDDASNDGTAEILQEYAKRYPHLIRLLLQSENQYSRGVKPGKFLRAMSRGEYIAICEGDDYWTHPHKLQKQVKFLQKNPSISFVFHNATVLDETHEKCWLFSDVAKPRSYNQKDLISRNMIPTASKVTRANLMSNDFNPPVGVPGDWVGHFMQSDRGDFYYLPDVMSVYRLHPGGIWSSKDDYYRLSKSIVTLNYFRRITGDKFLTPISQTLRSQVISFLTKRAISMNEALAAINQHMNYNSATTYIWGWGAIGKGLANLLTNHGISSYRVIDIRDLSTAIDVGQRYLSPRDFLSYCGSEKNTLFITTMFFTEVVDSLLIAGWASFDRISLVVDTNIINATTVRLI